MWEATLRIKKLVVNQKFDEEMHNYLYVKIKYLKCKLYRFPIELALHNWSNISPYHIRKEVFQLHKYARGLDNRSQAAQPSLLQISIDLSESLTCGKLHQRRDYTSNYILSFPIYLLFHIVLELAKHALLLPPTSFPELVIFLNAVVKFLVRTM